MKLKHFEIFINSQNYENFQTNSLEILKSFKYEAFNIKQFQSLGEGTISNRQHRKF